MVAMIAIANDEIEMPVNALHKTLLTVTLLSSPLLSWEPGNNITAVKNDTAPTSKNGIPLSGIVNPQTQLIFFGVKQVFWFSMWEISLRLISIRVTHSVTLTNKKNRTLFPSGSNGNSETNGSGCYCSKSTTNPASEWYPIGLMGFRVCQPCNYHTQTRNE